MINCLRHGSGIYVLPKQDKAILSQNLPAKRLTNLHLPAYLTLKACIKLRAPVILI